MSDTRSYQQQFALYGIIVGLIFPIVGTLIECSIRFGFFEISHLWECQSQNPLLWIIDTAPLFLGLLAAFGGKQMDKVKERNLELNEKYTQMNVLRQMADSANKAKSEFLATMSHEIRTPLSAIIGYNNLLKESALMDEQKHFVDTIGIATENLLVIINDILDSSRLEAGMVVLENKTFSLQQLVQNVVRICNDRAVSKGLKIILTYDNSIPAYLEWDATRLSQILLNLMSNAIKFTGQGQVELKVEGLNRSSRGIRLRFAVKDTGIGIRKENLDRIFQRFTQEDVSTSRIYGGTGLGLHIVRSLLELFQGKLEVSSQPGSGSEFSFEIELPYAVEIITDADVKEEVVPVVLVLDGMKVLLAEDNEFNLFLAETYLKRNGVEVFKATNGMEAVQLAQVGKFDAILMDIQMPVMDGKEAVRMLRKQGNDVPVIACSAHAVSSEKAECLALGMNEYLTKPFEEKELIKVLSTYFVTFKSPRNMEIQGDPVEDILVKIRADVGPDFVAIIIAKFNSDMPVLADDLEEHLQDMAFKSIQEKTHRLAGIMATFRFPEGLRLARVAEYAARDAKDEETRAGIRDLTVYLKNTLEQLAAIR